MYIHGISISVSCVLRSTIKIFLFFKTHACLERSYRGILRQTSSCSYLDVTHGAKIFVCDKLGFGLNYKDICS